MTQAEKDKLIKDLQDKLAEAEKIEVDAPKRWKPEVGRCYWCVEEIDEVTKSTWLNDRFDEWRYLTGNCFKTKEEAEEYKKQIEYTARYKNYIEEHSEPIVWDGEQRKWYAEFDTADGNIEINCVYGYKVQGVIHASSEQIIKDAIKEIGVDNFKEYVLRVK